MTNAIWIHQARPRATWYGLDSATKDELLAEWATLDATASKAGAEFVGTYSIRGQSDFATIEIWRFEGPEDAFNFWSDRIDANYAVWFAFSNQLGIDTYALDESLKP